MELVDKFLLFILLVLDIVLLYLVSALHELPSVLFICNQYYRSCNHLVTINYTLGIRVRGDSYAGYFAFLLDGIRDLTATYLL